MSFRTVLLIFAIVSGMAMAGIVAFVVYQLRQAAAQAEASRRAVKLESDCDGQVDHAIELVAQRDQAKGIVNRLIDTRRHYNHVLSQCYVEVTTYEHRESPVYVKTLINPYENSAAVLWSLTGRAEDPGRQCFGPDSMPIDCAEADKRWKTFMTE